jgi:hypothetical protein
MKVLSIPNSDYKIITKTNGRITFDVGNDGEVLITGDLTVAGDVTTIQSETLTVRDNIIYLNIDDNNNTPIVANDPGAPWNGSTGYGISSIFNHQAGFEIKRGSNPLAPIARLLLDDSVWSIRANGAAKNGTWIFKDANGASMGIQTCSIKTGPNERLFLINQGTGYVSVAGTQDYEKNALNYSQYWPTYPLGTPTYSGPITITEDDALPNAKAMGDFLTSSLYFFDDWRIIESNTSVSVYDSAGGNTYRPVGYTPPATSNISFTVDGVERGKFTPVGLDVDNINIFTSTINNSTTNLILTSTATNKIVEVDAVLQLDDKSTSPAAVAGATKIYTVNSNTTPAPGKTGIYFTNQGNSDELVAKNRALLFSILF